LDDNTVTGLFHIGLCVADLDRSIDFYTNVAGMTLVESHVSRSDTFDALSNNKDSQLAVAYLALGGFRLQLVQYLRAGGVTLDVHHNNVGSPHMSLFVDDVDSEMDRVRSLDVRVTSDIVVLSETMRSFYVEDPDGVPVEFLQLTGRLPAGVDPRGADRGATSPY